MALRRMRAKAARIRHADVWPIDEKTAAVPPNWPGWPDGRRFAVVLTHDVEGSKGLARVEALMNLERRHGFRSSFNLVPEGEYRVPDSLRETLDAADFEVGIHGLQHDGKLYTSKAHFAATAARIREYARRWKVAGFRSPFMQHKLGWLHELGLEYDASTFDTDPFEPQPDAAATIFPFWVPGRGGSGYVELPYTLVQDFSLFIVLGDRNIDTWKAKVDWVAAQGGMVLLNTHPDYMCFGGKPARDEFPVALYEELLRYIREKYEGAYWPALPREVARYYCASLAPAARNTRKKICMVAYSSHETDNRVRRYAEALASRGDQVDVIAVAGGDVPLGSEVLSGVTVHRIQRRERNERNKWDYAFRLLRFLLASSIFLARMHRRKLYDVIHVHNVPDFLVFAAWYPKWTGVSVILDVHDIVPELYASKFHAQPGDRRVAALRRVEKASAGFADHVIVSNHLWHEKLVSRSIPKDKCSVFLNHVDRTIFYRRARIRKDDRFIVLFPGSFQWHQGLDLAIEAFAILRQTAPHAEFHIYGGGTEADALVALTKRLGLEATVKFCGGVSLDDMPDLIANADLGVVPKRANSFGNEAYSTKIMEFMSQGVPVVVSRTKIDTFYYDENAVRFFPSGDSAALAEAILEVIQTRELRESLIAAGTEYVSRHAWDVKKQDYLDLLDTLTTESFEEFHAPPALPVVTGQPGF
jgi:glycosyltransferase involved in cell wall biosynthesis/peptidoglycan/xylan/chitin deacetylase (PgdA/CDA1 family)